MKKIILTSAFATLLIPAAIFANKLEKEIDNCRGSYASADGLCIQADSRLETKGTVTRIGDTEETYRYIYTARIGIGKIIDGEWKRVPHNIFKVRYPGKDSFLREDSLRRGFHTETYFSHYRKNPDSEIGYSDYGSRSQIVISHLIGNSNNSLNGMVEEEDNQCTKLIGNEFYNIFQCDTVYGVYEGKKYKSIYLIPSETKPHGDWMNHTPLHERSFSPHPILIALQPVKSDVEPHDYEITDFNDAVKSFRYVPQGKYIPKKNRYVNDAFIVRSIPDGYKFMMDNPSSKTVVFSQQVSLENQITNPPAVHAVIFSQDPIQKYEDHIGMEQLPLVNKKSSDDKGILYIVSDLSHSGNAQTSATPDLTQLRLENEELKRQVRFR